MKYNTCPLRRVWLTTASDQRAPWCVCRRPRAPALWRAAGTSPGERRASCPWRALRSWASALGPKPHSPGPAPRGTPLRERCQSVPPPLTGTALVHPLLLCSSHPLDSSVRNHHTLFLIWLKVKLFLNKSNSLQCFSISDVTLLWKNDEQYFH